MDPSSEQSKTLLSLIELGGYPDFSPLYNRCGYEVVIENSMRKTLTYLKKHSPDVIVAEFNYQSSFRDRLSSLESLIAVVQRNPVIKVIVFYEQENRHQFDRLRSQYHFFDVLSYPVDEGKLEKALLRARAEVR